MSIKSGLRRLKVHPYYYIPPCPECNSRITGRYIKDRRDTDINYIITDALKHGEIVKAVPEIRDSKNVFCLECQNEWYEPIEMCFLSKEELDEEKRKRYTNEILAERREAISIANATPAKRNIFQKVFGMIGKP